METAPCLPPLEWSPYDRRLPQRIIEFNNRQDRDAGLQHYSLSDTDSQTDSELLGLQWYNEIHHVNELCDEDDDEEVLKLVGSILCQAMSIPRDCTRPLLEDEKHHLFFFTNQRVIQIYCAHDINEKLLLDSLYLTDIDYQERKEEYLLDQGGTYEALTKEAFAIVKPFLAWECLYPEGIDMAALSPLDINANLRSRGVASKERTKAPVAKPSQREKDHPPPPPAEVREPPGSDRKNGAVYNTGKLLGKGGFAICYDSVLAGTRQKYALKIVKSIMPQKKMEQKVRFRRRPIYF